MFYFQVRYQIDANFLGVYPRNYKGLPGAITHVFIHGNLNHILSNTISFLVLGLLLFTGYRKISFKVFFLLYFFTGMLLWVTGRNSEEGHPVYHIGSSGLIFALFGFLIVSGILRGNKPQMAISALVIFLYGYFIWGIFPLEKQISWDGHLSGLLSGIFIGVLMRKKEPQSKKIYFSEEDESELDRLPEQDKYWLHHEDKEEVVMDQPKTDYNQIILNINYEFKSIAPKSETDKGKD